MTPCAIEVLIHCHVSNEPHPRKDFPAVREEFENLEANGLIRMYGSHGVYAYTTTEKGAAHVAQLCATPFPTQAWLDAQGKVIELAQ